MTQNQWFSVVQSLLCYVMPWVKKTLFLLLLSFVSLYAYGANLDFSLKEVPTNYRIRQWNSNLNSVKYNNELSKSFGDLNFSIPKEFLVYDSSSELNLRESLINWRKSTPVAYGNPRTVNGTGYYPFKNADGGFSYIALEHLLDRREKHPKLNVVFQNSRPQASNGTRVRLRRVSLSTSQPPVPKPPAQIEEITLTEESTLSEADSQNSTQRDVLSKLTRIRENPSSLSCSSNIGDAASCLVCNCYFEARGEPSDGKIAVNRTVLTRMERKGFPDDACGVIWRKAQNKRGKWVAAFSWTLQSYKNNRMNANEVKSCVSASISAVNRGTWQWDHFYNPKTASPSWGPTLAARNGDQMIGNHRFLNSGVGSKEVIDRLIFRNDEDNSEGVQ